ncbi:aminotransferase class I/II-fold pyridoxal phosphate-dependent enzyme [Mesonia maritima]|uniref:Aspartate/methionine/tyrosine aminotransferase n=1 Tax=Mesonia maritima TaxID=1793873 RepID=A0ABU1KCB6_9FLAO|nr:aminotransferase class I/II-fold pyridoxal phosphate-dependent enzyme [Mesonia maritima]MDR6302102.1 aspartate/methionine/tyrosine aminotransferase [Mesonia maritima]
MEKSSDLISLISSNDLKKICNKEYELIDFTSDKIELFPPYQSVTQLHLTLRQEGAHEIQKNSTQPLREAFQQFFQHNFKINLPLKNSTILQERKRALFTIAFSLLAKGDSVLCPNPGREDYRQISELVGAKPIQYSLEEKNNWLPDFTELRKLLDKNVKLMWLDIPQFPTGAKLNISDWENLISFTEENKIILVIDNSQSFILNNNPESIFNYTGNFQHKLELFTLKETFNNAAWQMGVVSGDENLIEKIGATNKMINDESFLPLQQASINALTSDSTSDWIKKQNLQHKNTRKKLQTFLTEINCKPINENSSGSFIWAKIESNGKTSIQFCEELLKKYSIFVMPGNKFGSAGEGYIWVSLHMNQSKIEEAINRIKNSV